MDFAALADAASDWSGVLSSLAVIALAIASLFVGIRGALILLGFIQPSDAEMIEEDAYLDRYF